MKRFLIALPLAFLLIFACFVGITTLLSLFFAPKDAILESLPDYEQMELYTSGEFQDYTDYGKYYYRISEQVLTNSPYFQQVDEANLPQLLNYLENYESWVAAVGGDVPEHYDFDTDSIETGDYFYILNRYEEPEREFHNYNIYYFDLDTQILYYFHNNI